MARLLSCVTVLLLAACAHGQVAAPATAVSGSTRSASASASTGSTSPLDLLPNLMNGVTSALSSVLPDLGSELVNGYQATLTGALGMFSGLAASIEGTTATTSANLAATQAAAAATVAGAATGVDTVASQAASTATSATNAATALVAGAVQGAQDAAASAAQALLTEVIGRAESALSSIGGIADNLELLYGKYEDAFCEQAYMKPSVWMPPNVTGLGFQVDFVLGQCELSGDPIPTFGCTGPSATFTTTPASFTAKYKSAVEFVGEQCAITKTFGVQTSEVLFVFDPKADPILHLGPVSNRINDAISNVFNLVGARSVSSVSAVANATGAAGPVAPVPQSGAAAPAKPPAAAPQAAAASTAAPQTAAAPPAVQPAAATAAASVGSGASSPTLGPLTQAITAALSSGGRR